MKKLKNSNPFYYLNKKELFCYLKKNAISQVQIGTNYFFPLLFNNFTYFCCFESEISDETYLEVFKNYQGIEFLFF